MNKKNETICALATPLGEGGIAVIKISGKDSLKVLKKIFRLPNGKLSKKFQSRHLIYGFIIDPKSRQRVDEVLVSFMQAPKTYTQEDVVEINSHSGLFVIEKILNLVLSAGTRLAEPGEFTKRAYLSGRIDLLEAESVCDLVKAKSEASWRRAQNQLQGRLSAKINVIKEELLDILAGLEANIDFIEEEIPQIKSEELERKIIKTKKQTEELLKNAKFDRLYREGINIALVGLPNVGKSSLFNALLEEERSIVTKIAGTTRDTIEETIIIKGIAAKLTDTAGITKAENKIDKEAIRRSEKAILEADLILLIFDASCQGLPDKFFKKIDKKLREQIKNKPIILVGNKADLVGKQKKKKLRDFENKKLILVSAKTRKDIESLENRVKKSVFAGLVKSETFLITKQRHKVLLEQALSSLEQALAIIKVGFSDDLIIIDLREALSFLLEITGEIFTDSSDKVLDKIFNNFCIGK